MFHAATGVARPAKFDYDRLGNGRKGPNGESVPTIWWITAMKSLDFTVFALHNADSMGDRDSPILSRARAVDNHEKDLIAQQITQVENAREPGDCITDRDEIRRLLDEFDYESLQTALGWCRSASNLEAAAK